MMWCEVRYNVRYIIILLFAMYSCVTFNIGRARNKVLVSFVSHYKVTYVGKAKSSLDFNFETFFWIQIWFYSST